VSKETGIQTGGRERSSARKLAEWITLSASIILVAAVAGYLLYDWTRPQQPSVPVEVRVLSNDARLEAGRYVVPIEVRNRGNRTLHNLKLHVYWKSTESITTMGEFSVDYLGERAHETAYLYFDRHPRDLEIEVRPFAYQLE
jgi:uncharacterized protein (TIGR02588 family)